MISELLAYDFMQRAILAVIAISIFSPILGLFLILRRQSLMSDTLSHVSLAGVAVGIFLGQSTTWMTLVVVVIAALVLEYLRVSYKHYMEISTAILMSMGLAVALILSNKAGSSSMSLDSYLFGSIITISSEQVRALFVIAAIVLVLTLLFIRPMYLLTFDEDTAHVDGLPVRLMSLLFNIVTGIAIALMIPAAGSLFGFYHHDSSGSDRYENRSNLQVCHFLGYWYWFDWYALWYLYFLLLGNTSQCNYHPYLHRLLWSGIHL